MSRFQEIKAFDGTAGTGADVRSKLNYNFEQAELAINELNAMVSGIYDVSSAVPLPTGQYYTATTARAAVPVSIRKKGMVISFNTSATAYSIQEFYQGEVSAWTTAGNWRDNTSKVLAAIAAVQSNLNLETTTRANSITALQNQITGLAGGYLGAIAYNAAAPTPAASGYYEFNTAGSCSWITGGAVTVKIGDRVSVKFTAPSTYVYTHINVTFGVEQVRSQNTVSVPSSKLLDDELEKINNYFLKSEDLLLISKNLYNKELQINGQNGAYNGYIDDSGNLVSHGTAKTSYYMDILPGLNYAYQAYYGNATRICTYDSNKTLVRIINLGNNTAAANGTFLAASNEVYARFSIRDVNTFMLEVGNTQSAYESYVGPEIKNEFLQTVYDFLNELQLLKADVTDLYNYLKASDIINSGKNLYNKELQINGQNGAYDGFIDDSGNLVAHGTAKTSYYMDILPGLNYAFQALYGYSTRICTYDSSKNLVRILYQGSGESAPANGTFTTLSNEVYARFSIRDVNTFMLEVGNTQSAYESYVKTDIKSKFLPTVYEFISELQELKADKTQVLDFLKSEDLLLMSKNMYNKELQINGQNGAYNGYIDNSGSLVAHGTAKTSYYMDILPGLNYAYQAYYGYVTRICTYDSNKTLVRIINLGNDTAAANGTFLAASNEVYARFSIRDVNTFMLEVGTTQSAYEIFRTTQIKNELLPDSSESFENVKFVIFGDSITEDTGSSDANWVDVFASVIKSNSIVNRGYGGMHYAWHSSTVETLTPSMDNNYNNVLWNHIKKWEATIPTTPDIFIIAAGTNDVSQNYPFGSMAQAFAQSLEATTQLTTANAMRKALQYLQMNYPNARIYVCTPIQAATRTWDNLYLVTATIKDVAARLSIPIIDCFNNCGIVDQYEIAGSIGRDLYDGTHPKASGANKQGSFIANEFKNKYYTIKSLVFE